MTVAEVAEAHGLSYRTLAKWIETGLLKPRKYRGRHGVPIEWGEKDGRELWLVLRLKGAGIPLERIRRVLKCIRSSASAEGDYLVLAREGAKVAAHICDGATAVAMTEDGFAEMIIPLWEHERRVPKD